MMVWIGLIVYILFIKLLLGPLDTEKKKKNFLFLVGIGIVFVMGSRYASIFAKGDLNNYYRMYFNISNTSWSELLSSFSMEPGYLILNKLCSTIFPWTQSIIYIEAIICIFFMSRFIYKFSPDVFLGILFYISQGLMIFQLTGFRQAIAISLCLFAMEFVNEKKLFKFLLIVLLACSFHVTAIVFIPMYFVANLRPGCFTMLMYGAGYFLLLQIVPSLLEAGSELTGSDYTEAATWGNFLGPAINIIIYIVTVALLSYLNKYDKSEKKWEWNMTALGMMVYLLRFISLPFERISFYFSASTAIALPSGILKSFDKQSEKIIYSLAVILSIGLYLMRVSGIEYRFFWT